MCPEHLSSIKKHFALCFISDWHFENFQCKIDMAHATTSELSEKLLRFYLEAKPRTKEGEEVEYHKNTLKNIRAGINRYLLDLGREINIVHDKEFHRANKCLDGMLKERMRSGTLRPTCHRQIISLDDQAKILEYFKDAHRAPVILRQSVWYNLARHFVSRGVEFLNYLTPNSFIFDKDKDGLEYVTLSPEIQQKYFREGQYSILATKRLYETGLPNCPIKMLRMFMSKTDPTAKFLFNHCMKEALVNPSQQIWYRNKTLGKRSFTSFMPDICKAALCSKRYTALCLLATGV